MRACKEGVQSANAESFRLMILDTFASLALRWPRDGAALLMTPSACRLQVIFTERSSVVSVFPTPALSLHGGKLLHLPCKLAGAGERRLQHGG
jgi:hypothetical protein